MSSDAVLPEEGTSSDESGSFISEALPVDGTLAVSEFSLADDGDIPDVDELSNAGHSSSSPATGSARGSTTKVESAFSPIRETMALT